MSTLQLMKMQTTVGHASIHEHMKNGQIVFRPLSFMHQGKPPINSQLANDEMKMSLNVGLT